MGGPRAVARKSRANPELIWRISIKDLLTIIVQISPAFFPVRKAARSQHMAGQSSFSEGKKYSILGVSLRTMNSWVRWGMPIATGLVVVLVLLALN